MITERQITKAVTDADVIRAIELKSSATYVTLSILRGIGIGGHQSGDAEPTEWWLVRTYTLQQLVHDAQERGRGPERRHEHGRAQGA